MVVVVVGRSRDPPSWSANLSEDAAIPFLSRGKERPGGVGGAGERGFSTLKGLVVFVLLYCLYACWWPKYFGHTVLPVIGTAPDTKTATVYTLAFSLWACTVQPLPLWLWPKCFYP